MKPLTEQEASDVRLVRALAEDFVDEWRMKGLHLSEIEAVDKVLADPTNRVLAARYVDQLNRVNPGLNLVLPVDGKPFVPSRQRDRAEWNPWPEDHADRGMYDDDCCAIDY
jgi:hypothetical protein